jgi:hypothetical protein
MRKGQVSVASTNGGIAPLHAFILGMSGFEG